MPNTVIEQYRNYSSTDQNEHLRQATKHESDWHAYGYCIYQRKSTLDDNDVDDDGNGDRVGAFDVSDFSDVSDVSTQSP